jgi:YfiH family protein
MGVMNLLIPDWPAPSCVRSAITTRLVGASVPPWDSFNLGFHVGDDPQVVTRNWRQLANELNLTRSPQLLNQVHGTKLVEARGDGVIPDADGCFSRRAGQACVVMTADCLPILLCNTAGTEVAAVHAGWRGLASGIVHRAESCFISSPNERMAYLGPAISQQYFEVGAEVRREFLCSRFFQHSQRRVSGCFVRKMSVGKDRSSGPEINDTEKWMADLYSLARIALNEIGVTQIYGGELCTYGGKERFYSYRRDGVTGRMASLIWIN